MTTIRPIGIPTLHAGCKAYIDTLKGLVPCVVVCVVGVEVEVVVIR